MITDEEISKLVGAFKDVFPTRTEIEGRFDGLKEDFSRLQTSIDVYSQKADTYFQEMVMLSHKVDRHERWLREIAQKLEMNLKA